MKHFDIYLRVHVLGYEKITVHRVMAADSDEAVIKGFAGEVHNLTEEEVTTLLIDAGWLHDGVEDGEMFVRLEDWVELVEVPVTINDEVCTALLPADPKDISSAGYFKK